MKTSTLLLAVFLLMLSCSTSKNDHQSIYSLASEIDSIALSNKFNGVIMIGNSSGIEFQKAYGFSDLEKKTTLKADDLFFIGSISKQITAVLVLREFEKGNLQLTDKIAQYLPEIKQSWANEVTIHHLLTHTHGIVEVNQPLEFEVGTKFHYSQVGFGLLSQILEKVQQISFQEIATALFQECNMHHTFYPSGASYKNLVKGYEENEEGKLILAEGNPVKYIAGGGFISNAKDIIQWNTLLHSGQLVSQATLNKMKTRYATRNHPVFDQIEYGYGLLFKDKQQDTEIGAFGYAPGFASAAYYYSTTNTSLIVLENVGLNLSDFKATFKVHTDLMKIMKNRK